MFHDFEELTKEDFDFSGKIGRVFDQAFEKKREELLKKNQSENGLKKSTIIKAVIDSLFEAIDWEDYCARYVKLSEADAWEIECMLFPFCGSMIQYLMKPEPEDPPVPHQPSKLTCSLNRKVRRRREQAFLQDAAMYLFSNVFDVRESTIPKRLLPGKGFNVLEEIRKLREVTTSRFIAKLDLIHRGLHVSVYRSQDIIVNGKYSIGAMMMAFTLYEAFSLPIDAIEYKKNQYSISRFDIAPGAYVSYRYLYIHSETKRHFDKIIDFLEKKPYLKFSLNGVDESVRKYFLDRDISGFSILNLFLQDNVGFTADESGHVTISIGEDLYDKFPQQRYFSAFLKAMNEWNHMQYDTENIEFAVYKRGNGPAVNPEAREMLMREQQVLSQKRIDRRR